MATAERTRINISPITEIAEQLWSPTQSSEPQPIGSLKEYGQTITLSLRECLRKVDYTKSDYPEGFNMGTWPMTDLKLGRITILYATENDPVIEDKPSGFTGTSTIRWTKDGIPWSLELIQRVELGRTNFTGINITTQDIKTSFIPVEQS